MFWPEFSLDIYQNDVSVNNIFLSLKTQAIMHCKSGDNTGILNPYPEVCRRIKLMKRKILLRRKKVTQIPEDIIGASIQPCLRNMSLGFVSFVKQ